MIKRSILLTLLIIAISESTSLKIYAENAETRQESSTHKTNTTSDSYNAFSPSEWTDWMKHSLVLVAEMIKHPTETSALTASSPFAIKAILRSIKGTRICELGAGTGPVTIPALKMLHATNRLEHYHAIECIDKNHAKLTKKVERLKAGWKEGLISKEFKGIGINAPVYIENAFFGKEWKAKDVEVADGSIDTVVCTIPLMRLSKEQIEGILDRTLKLLKPDGTMIWISLLGARKRGAIEASLRSGNADVGKQYFDKLTLIDSWISTNFNQKTETIWGNLTPMFVYTAQRKTN